MEQILFPILAIAIVVGLYYLAKLLPSQAEYRGRRGEQRVFSILKQLPDEYYIWNDIVLQRNGYFVQIDHVVISPYGIFVIETKNYTGWIYGNDDSDQWTKNMYGYKYHFGNPLKQNYSHVKALASLFCKSVNDFIPIVVFLHGANLRCNTRGKVIYAGQLLDEIYSHRSPVMTPAEVQSLAAILNAAAIETKDTRKEHLNKVYESIGRKNYQIYNGICPKCGGQLVERRGRYGYFLGCSNYPKCKFTTPI
ncbi:MAG: NERD domain-containing protein [Prevotella sp.]|nr:NERD domain-containing protein [Prevotella sp.]